MAEILLLLQIPVTKLNLYRVTSQNGYLLLMSTFSEDFSRKQISSINVAALSISLL